MEPWIADGIVLAFALLGAGLTASIETALIGLPESRVRWAMEQQLPGAKHMQIWLDVPGSVLATLHLVRYALFVVGGVVAFRLGASQALPWPATITVAVVAPLALLFAHLLPGALAKRSAFDWARRTMPAVRALTIVCSVVVGPAQWLGRALSGLLGDREWQQHERDHVHWTHDEIARLAESARAAGLEQPDQALLQSIIEFSDTIIREIMVPRTNMVAIHAESSEADVRRIVIEAGHSRLPVYGETIDDITGLLHVKDLFAWSTQQLSNHTAEPIDLKALVRPTFYVPEVMQISELLREFQRRKTHMAIVVDEYGGTAGVVTLEDIIEEIVGEIQDEYDVEDKQFRIIGDKVLADGRVNLWDLEQTLGVEFPDEGGYETLAGFLMTRTGYLPDAGTVVSWEGLRFTIKEANEKRIRMVEIDRSVEAAAKR